MAGVLSVQDVYDRVKRTFGDESAVQVTDADILRWINDAQREAVMQTEGLLQQVAYINVTAGTGEYILPADLFTLSHLYFKDTSTAAYFKLKWLSLHEFSEYVDGWDGSDYRGYPIIYTNQTSDKVYVFPLPNTTVTQGIKIIYSRYADDVTSTADTIDLPPYLHSFVVNFCLMQAYEMDEDWESASQKAQQIQGDLDFNNNKQFWFGRETYPMIAESQDYNG